MKRFADWLFEGIRLPIAIVAFIVIVVVVTVSIVWTANRPESTTVTAYITVQGLENGFENRQIKIEDGDSIANIFSLKYKDIYEAFGQPFIQYNEFQSFMGVRKTEEKSFHVTIDGRFDSNLSQAYVYGGQTVVISYY